MEIPSQATSVERGACTPPVAVATLVWAGIVAALLAWLYAPSIIWMVRDWTHYEYYRHGFLVPLVSGWLIWRRKEALASEPVAPYWPAGLLAVAAVLVYLLALWLDVHSLSAASLVPLTIGLTGWIWGKRVLRELAFPLAFLAFMIPLGPLVNQASNPLQRLATVGAGALLQLARMPAEVVGTQLTVPGYVMVVGAACSGLKSVISLTALAALAAYLLVGPPWKRALLFAASVPVALLANIVRVVAIALIGRTMGADVAEGFLHEFSGLLVFLVGLFGLIGLGVALGCDNLREDI